MSKKEKLIARLLSKPKDFTWDELCTLFKSLGFVENKERGGSYRSFDKEGVVPFLIHKPHPGKILKMYKVKNVISFLIEEGLI